MAAAVALLAAVGAGVPVRVLARTPRACSCWWIASAIAPVGLLVATRSAAPAAATLSGVGLSAAAVIDAVEGRIPTALAGGTTAAVSVLLAGHGLVTGEWGVVLRAAALALGLTAAFHLVWLSGGMGFGDVRLAGATASAFTSGVRGLAVLLGGAFALTTVLVVVRRRLGGSRGRVPFAPALAVGWLAATWLG
jgi:leader peptidase (prepilin peptidase)/N-methyltransferase